MFDEIFNQLHGKNKEIKLMGVWGKDGLELEKKFFSEIDNLDLDFAGAELADIISKIENMKLSPEQYYLKLNVGRYVLLLFSLTNDFYFIMLTDQTVIPGKLNFFFNLYKNKMIASL